MMKRLLLLGIGVFIMSNIFAQDVKTIKISGEKSKFEVVSKSNSDSFEFLFEFGDLKFIDTETKKGNFYSLTTDGLVKTYKVGSPDLPVLSKLIEIPQDAEVEVSVVSYDEVVYNLKDFDIVNQIIPAQASVSKSEDFADQDFVCNSEVYKTDAYTNTDIVSFENIGTMRATRLGRVQVSPIQYNPVKNEIKILNNIKIEVVFKNGNISKTQSLKAKYNNLYFNQLTTTNTINQIESSKALIEQSPVEFVIVSDPMFETQLQEFIEWKTKKGFHVTVGYTDEIGTSTSAIKTWLQDLYEGDTPPSFVLLVGDHAQIPGWSGSSGSHVTDLRYCEYTGDDLPEVFYGRFSASTTAQLQPQIDKSLEYEQYLMPDPTYLEEVVMVAGDDSSYEMIYGNGQINYGVNTYFNENNNLTPHTYLQPLDNSSASTQIIQNVSDGVAFGNYTAHCSPDGWATPSFTISDISGLQNENQYGLLVGNCCLSNKFDVDCFGENLLRAENKGAIGYIGGTNSTYWDEDYWWGVGLIATPVSEPTYETTGAGAYDKMFHNLANEVDDISTWYITQAQMVVGGNMAVEASTSTRKQYYWEIYTLMGDPSIMPYMGVPSELSVVANPSVIVYGATSLNITTEPYAYVALSQSGTLISTALADETGTAILEFESNAITIGSADLVVTAQNKQPYIGTIGVITPEGAFIVLESYTIDDAAGNNNGLADYNETLNINLTLKNVGQDPSAGNVIATMTPLSSDYHTLTNNEANFGTLGVNENNVSSLKYTVTISNNIPDQAVIPFDIAITDGVDEWEATLNLKVNAPEISIGNLFVQDDDDESGILDPGENGSIVFEITNTGHATGVFSADLSLVESPNAYLTLGSTSVADITIEPEQSQNFVFTNATADLEAPLGTPVSLQLNVVASEEYTEISNQDIIIGIIPIYYISDGGELTVCTGTFYDSGGPDGDYQGSENYTMTFLTPANKDYVVVDFLEFETESGYDKLFIYDGVDDSAPEIEGSPFQGTTSPGMVYGTDGLTFKFTSDGYANRTGWVADVSCYSLTDAPDCASNPMPENEATNVFPTMISWTGQWADSYDVYFGTNPDPMTNTPETLTENSMMISVEPNTTYYWTVIPENSIGQAEGCDIWSFETGAAQYFMTESVVETCEGVFYDDGGLEDYSADQDITMTFLTPEGEDMIVIEFVSFDTESGYDKLYIYDGPDDTYPEIEGSPFQGTTSPGTVYGTNGLTFYFHSDYGFNKAGWEANISCYSVTEVPDCATNPYPANETTGVFPSILTWNATFADEYDVYFGTNPDPFTNSPETVTEKEYAVSVEPNTQYYWAVIPKNSVGEAEGCDVWTFETGAEQYIMSSTTITTCDGVFYDDGGLEDYSNSQDLTMTFYPETDGAMLHFEFISFDVEISSAGTQYDYLDVYDGSSTDAELIGSFSADDGAPVPEELQDLTATNSEGAITFVFHSDSSVPKAGWEANISCVSGGTDYYSANFTVLDQTTSLPIENATIEIGTETEITDANGLAVFELENGQYSYTVTADGYVNYGPEDLTIDSQNESITVNMTLDVSINELDSNISIYPNPNNGLFTIETNYDNSSIEILDITGKLLFAKDLNSKVEEINLSELSKGIYLIKINNNSNTVNSLIIIE